jgi:hypothetical protein
MELAIPGVALGLLYVVSNQNKKNENFTNKQNELPNTDVLGLFTVIVVTVPAVTTAPLGTSSYCTTIVNVPEPLYDAAILKYVPLYEVPP